MYVSVCDVLSVLGACQVGGEAAGVPDQPAGSAAAAEDRHEHGPLLGVR